MYPCPWKGRLAVSPYTQLPPPLLIEVQHQFQDRQTLSTQLSSTDKLCRQTLSTLNSGTPAFVVGFVYRICLQGLSARSGNADKVCLHTESLSKVFCKVLCSGNAGKGCLQVTCLSVFGDSIIKFSDGQRCIPRRARVQPPVRVELLLGLN